MRMTTAAEGGTCGQEELLGTEPRSGISEETETKIKKREMVNVEATEVPFAGVAGCGGAGTVSWAPPSALEK